VIWVGSSKDDLKRFPPDVQNEVGHALYEAQLGLKPHKAKPHKGFSGASVLEIRDDFDSDTYRAVYYRQIPFGNLRSSLLSKEV